MNKRKLRKRLLRGCVNKRYVWYKVLISKPFPDMIDFYWQKGGWYNKNENAYYFYEKSKYIVQICKGIGYLIKNHPDIDFKIKRVRCC